MLPTERNHHRPENSTKDQESSAGGTRRRSFLASVGSGALLTGLGMGSVSGVQAMQDGPGGPPNPDDWSLQFEDQFEGDSLDTSKWSLGWGWGTTTDTSSTEIVEENVTVEDGSLKLVGTHEGDDVFSGAVNTRDTATFGPGTYFEAQLTFARREGFHPAFWAKPTEYAWWPPEIDAAELLQNGSGEDDTTEVATFLHYSESTEPGDESTHQRLRQFHRPGDDVTENPHVYAIEWLSDGITLYVDGQEMRSFTNDTMLASMENGAPFYINISQNINVDTNLNEYLGTADTSESWGEETVVDWMRIWEQ